MQDVNDPQAGSESGTGMMLMSPTGVAGGASIGLSVRRISVPPARAVAPAALPMMNFRRVIVDQFHHLGHCLVPTLDALLVMIFKARHQEI